MRRAQSVVGYSITDFILCLLSSPAHVSLRISTQTTVGQNKNGRLTPDWGLSSDGKIRYVYRIGDKNA